LDAVLPSVVSIERSESRDLSGCVRRLPKLRCTQPARSLHSLAEPALSERQRVEWARSVETTHDFGIELFESDRIEVEANESEI
jgi:hypothetical protein